MEFSDGVPLHIELYNEQVQSIVKRTLLISGSDCLVMERVTVCGTEYRRDSILVLRKTDYSLVLGKILLVLVTPAKTVHFIVKQYIGNYVSDMNYYEVCDIAEISQEEYAFHPRIATEVVCVEYSLLDNVSCLQPYKVGDHTYIVLKHAVIYPK